MSHSDVTLLVTSLASLAPGLLALLLALAAYIQAHSSRETSAKNTARLDHLENGGGDKKIDDRLAKIGLVERRDADGVPTPLPTPTSAPTGTQEAASGV